MLFELFTFCLALFCLTLDAWEGAIGHPPSGRGRGRGLGKSNREYRKRTPKKRTRWKNRRESETRCSGEVPDEIDSAFIILDKVFLFHFQLNTGWRRVQGKKWLWVKRVVFPAFWVREDNLRENIALTHPRFFNVPEWMEFIHQKWIATSKAHNSIADRLTFGQGSGGVRCEA